ncbi:hypothetical protein [Variovorax defluvii]
MPTGQPTNHQAARNNPQGMPLNDLHVPAHLAGTVYSSLMPHYGVREFRPLRPADVPLRPEIPPDSESDSEDQAWGGPGEDQRQEWYALEPYPPHPLLPGWQLTNPLPPNPFPMSPYPRNQYPTSLDVPFEFSLVAEPEQQYKRQRIETPPIFDKPPPVPQQRIASQLSGKPAFGGSLLQALQAVRRSLEHRQVAPIIDDLIHQGTYRRMADHVLSIRGSNAKGLGEALFSCALSLKRNGWTDEAKALVLLCRAIGFVPEADDLDAFIALLPGQRTLPEELSDLRDACFQPQRDPVQPGQRPTAEPLPPLPARTISVRGQQATSVQEPARAQRPPLTLDQVDAMAKRALRLYMQNCSVIAQIVGQLAPLDSYIAMIDHVLQMDSSARSSGANALLVCARWLLGEDMADEAQLMGVLFALLGRVPISSSLRIDDVQEVLRLGWRLPPELDYLGAFLRDCWPKSSHSKRNAISKIVHGFCATAPATTMHVIDPPERGAQTPSTIVRWHHYSLNTLAAPPQSLASRIDPPRCDPDIGSQRPMDFSNGLRKSNDAVILDVMPGADEDDSDAALIDALKNLELSGYLQIRCRNALVAQGSYTAMIHYVYGLDREGRIELVDPLAVCGLMLLDARRYKPANRVGLLVLANNRLPRWRKLSIAEWRALLPPTWPLPAEFGELRTNLLEQWKTTSAVAPRRVVAELVHERYGDRHDAN